MEFDSAVVDCAMERTTSPLQIGHVRRRVVSHGVLLMGISLYHIKRLAPRFKLTCIRREIRGHKVSS